jgi:hypothetical protein
MGNLGGPNGRTTVMSSMQDHTNGRRGGRIRGGRNGGGRGHVRFQEDANERTSISSTEIVEYNTDDAQHRQSDNTLTECSRRQERPRLWARRLQKARRRSQLTPWTTGFAYDTSASSHPHSCMKTSQKICADAQSCTISIISKRHVGRTSHLQDVKHQTSVGFIAKNNELDTHTDTCCAGANWRLLMELTNEISEVNPFLAS